MKQYLKFVCCLLLMVLTAAFAGAAEGRAKPKPKPAEKACVSKLHVIKGCTACETMIAWLRAAGIKLEIENVQQGQFRLYPSVVYSDKFVDHGERMYRQEVTIPSTICVVSCSVGTN